MKLKAVCFVALGAMGLVGCGAGASEPGSSPDESVDTHGAAERNPAGASSTVEPSKITIDAADGQLTFVNVHGAAVVIGNTGLETAGVLARSMLQDGSTPLEAYLAFADKRVAPPVFLVKDHELRTTRAPVAIVLPSATATLRTESAMGTYTDTCTTAHLQATANVGLPSFTSSLTVSAPNPFGNSTQWISTRSAPQAYMYLGCATSGSSVAQFRVKFHTDPFYMDLPFTVSGTKVAYLIHSTLWDDGVGDATENLDLWSSMSTSSNVCVHGRVGTAQP